MATLNFIMPRDLKDGFCEREEKTTQGPTFLVAIWTNPCYIRRRDSD